MSMKATPECYDGTCTCAEDEGFSVSPEDANRNRVAVGLPPVENPVRFTVHRHV